MHHATSWVPPYLAREPSESKWTAPIEPLDLAHPRDSSRESGVNRVLRVVHDYIISRDRKLWPRTLSVLTVTGANSAVPTGAR